MKNTLFIIFLFVFVNHYAQIEEHTKSKKELRIEKRAQKRKDKEERIKSYINPKGKWFFGAEIGSNRIINYDIKKDKISFQGGFLAEYYIARHWSVSTKIKYFETGVSFEGGGGSGWFSSPYRAGTFRGRLISIPLYIKWEFRLFKNLGGSFKYGATYNQEFKRNYTNYKNINTNRFKSIYFSSIGGWGLNYFFNNNSAVYIDSNIFTGTRKGEVPSLLSNGVVFNTNILTSIGYKYSFN